MMKTYLSSNRWFLLSLPLTFLALFYFYPLVKIFIVSFAPDGSFELERLRQLTSSDSYYRILRFTFWQAGLSTLLTLVIALPGAYIFTRFDFPGKNILQAVMTVPFVLPTVVTAAAFRALLGSGGLVNSLLMSIFNLPVPPVKIDQTVVFFLLAHVFYNYTLVVRIVSGYWSQLNPHQNQAARMLGASPWQAFTKITLPQLAPAIGSAALLVFIFCFTSFGVVLILGGPGYATIEVEIYRQAVQLFNLPMAAALSLIQILINFLLMWLHARLSRKNRVSFFSNSGGGMVKKAETWLQKSILSTNILFMSVLLLTPLGALIFRSFIGEGGVTLSYYTALFTTSSNSVFFVPPIDAVVNSVGFAVTAMCISLVLGIFASTYLASARGRNATFWDAIIMLPLATSAVTLGFGYIITLNSPPLNLRDSVALIPIAHALVAFPFVVRCILPALRQIPQTLREAAMLLGSSPFQVWHSIVLPLISRSVIVGAIFAFSISMGEFGASAFITRPHTSTMPVAIFRFLGQPGDMNYGQAMAMSTLLMFVTTSGFWLLGRFSDKR